MSTPNRRSVARTRCSGKWTESQFKSFIKSTLRKASLRWGPIGETLRGARVDRGIYLCNGCKKEGPLTKKVGDKKIKNAVVDHISPIIDPKVGFVGWDSVIERMFCETDNLQVLCYDCHKEKTQKERDIAREVKKNGK